LEENSTLFGLMSSCQFFWIIFVFLPCPRHHPIVAGDLETEEERHEDAHCGR
jgi:hypothetical protein